MHSTAAIVVVRGSNASSMKRRAGSTARPPRLGKSTHDFLVAGRHMRVRFAGSALAHLARPLAHLKCDRCGAVGRGAGGWRFWRGTVRMAGCLRGPLGISGNLRIAGRLPAWRTTGIASTISAITVCSACTIGKRGEPSTGCRTPPSCRFGNLRLRSASCSIGGHSRSAAKWSMPPPWDATAKECLLAGRGGSGKSTTAITCVDAGMQYVGDDYVLLTRDANSDRT